MSQYLERLLTFQDTLGNKRSDLENSAKQITSANVLKSKNERSRIPMLKNGSSTLNTNVLRMNHVKDLINLSENLKLKILELSELNSQTMVMLLLLHALFITHELSSKSIILVLESY